MNEKQHLKKKKDITQMRRIRKKKTITQKRRKKIKKALSEEERKWKVDFHLIKIAQVLYKNCHYFLFN